MNRAFIVFLYISLLTEILLALLFIAAAGNVSFTLIFPPDTIETPKEELRRLFYLPFILLGLSGGFAWLAFKTTRKIQIEKGARRRDSASFYWQTDQWKIISITLVYLVSLYLVLVNFW